MRIDRETVNPQLQICVLPTNLQRLCPIDLFQLHQMLSDQGWFSASYWHWAVPPLWNTFQIIKDQTRCSKLNYNHPNWKMETINMWVLFKAALFQTKHQMLHVELKLTCNNAWTLLRGKTTVYLRGQNKDILVEYHLFFTNGKVS